MMDMGMAIVLIFTFLNIWKRRIVCDELRERR